MEFITGLVTGYLLTWPVIALTMVFAFTTERGGDSLYSLFWVVVGAVISFFYFDLALADISWYIALYAVIGVMWSFWRYHRYVKARINEMLKTQIKNYSVEEFKEIVAERCGPQQLVDRIAAWIIIWPVSVIENLTADIYDAVVSTIKNVLSKFYNMILNSILRGINDGVIARKGK